MRQRHSRFEDLMLRATSVVRKAAVRADRVVDTVTLDHDGRTRRRFALKGDRGLEFLLDLDRTTVLNDGDALKLDDGRLIAVKAAPQRLLQVRAENPLRLLKVAYHVGNRHTPAEVTAEAIYIEDDPVLAELVRGQGCTATPVNRPFQPERGAYDHDCGHDHAHAPEAQGHDHHGHDHHGHHHHGHEHHGHGHHGQETYSHEHHDQTPESGHTQDPEAEGRGGAGPNGPGS
jgi:urease accessory protein